MLSPGEEEPGDWECDGCATYSEIMETLREAVAERDEARTFARRCYWSNPLPAIGVVLEDCFRYPWLNKAEP